MAPLHSLRGTVFWSETDSARIAHFSSFFKMCEWAEEDFYRRLVGDDRFHDILKQGVMFPRVRAECSFEYPLHVHDDYRVDIVDVVVGGKSVAYAFEVWNETHGRLSARCTIVTVAVDIGEFRAVDVPQDLREALLRAGARVKDGAGSNS